MKKTLYLLLASILFGAVVFTGCSREGQEKDVEVTGTETGTTEAASVDADIPEKVIGKWIIDEVDGRPALTNEKGVFTFPSAETAYISAAFNSNPDFAPYWGYRQEAAVAVDGNLMTLTSKLDEHTTIVDELNIASMTDTETKGHLVVTLIKNGKETVIRDAELRLARVTDDYREDILGTWEGHCTSEGSIFDDGQDHRWEYKSNGTYVYYVKKDGEWVPGDNTLNEYFVDGNLLCSRWMEGDKEYREWWEITIDDDKMNWTALREGEDATTFTPTFEMTRIEE